MDMRLWDRDRTSKATREEGAQWGQGAEPHQAAWDTPDAKHCTGLFPLMTQAGWLYSLVSTELPLINTSVSCGK